MRIAIFETEEWEQDACLQLARRHELTCTKDVLTPESAKLHKGAEAISVFVNSRLNSESLSSFPDLRLITTRSTGYDHIDLNYCRLHGITVCNVPSYGDNTVAEHSFALMLAVSRKLIQAAGRTRGGEFDTKGLRGFDLRGRTLGVIGTGRIGARVIEIANGFGMQILAFDAAPNLALAQRLGFRYANLDEILAQADVITLHVPATKATAHMISDREFGLMKTGCVLINTARGHIVDIPALVRALSGGKLRGVGLDVLPHEPLLRDEAEVFRRDVPEADVRAILASNILLQMPNVVVTPHNAFNTEDAVAKIIATTIQNIDAFADGEPINTVALPASNLGAPA